MTLRRLLIAFLVAGTSGELCKKNEYVEYRECVPCPPGTTNAAGDDSTGAATKCDLVVAGTYGERRCGENEHVADGACVACPPETTNAAGDPALGGDTSCDPVVKSSDVSSSCAEDEHVVEVPTGIILLYACEACPDGETNEAGDAPADGPTDCDPPVDALGVATCGEGEHVAGGACVACPPGTVNAAGDDPAGGDTYCDTICGADEHVVLVESTFISRLTCAACPEGTTNEAGDVQADGPTECDAAVDTFVVICEDDWDWHKAGDDDYDCGKVYKKNEKKKWKKKKAKKNCKTVGEDGRTANDACACDACNKDNFAKKKSKAASVVIAVPVCVGGVLLVGGAYLATRKRKTAKTQRRLSHRASSMPTISKPEGGGGDAEA